MAGPDQKREDRENAVSHLLEEARMLLPGIQALFGFQLMAVFNQGFREIPRPEQYAHYSAIFLVALCVLLVLAPAAYHRQSEPLMISNGFLRWAGCALATAMAPLALALALDLEVVGYAIVHQHGLAVAIAAVVLLGASLLWFALPARKRWEQRDRAHDQLIGA
jgi:hypothetical protein